MAMRRAKFDTVIGLTRQRSVQILVLLGFLYMVLMSVEVPFFFMTVSLDSDDASAGTGFHFQNDAVSLRSSHRLDSEEELQEKKAPIRPLKEPLRVSMLSSFSESQRQMREYKSVSGLNFDWRVLNSTRKDDSLGFTSLPCLLFKWGRNSGKS